MKKYTSILAVAAGALVITACGTAHGNDPGNEYAPDMYVSKGYEPFSQLAEPEKDQYVYNEHHMTMRKPPMGTIARGQLAYAYPYANNAEGYESAKAELKNPVPLTEENLATGKHLYGQQCAVCHGADGRADGEIIKAKKFPPPPAYQSDRIKQLPVGGMYHSITYGKGMMGSYASALSPEERWKVVHYIEYLRDIDGAAAKPAAAAADSTKN